MSGVVVTEIYPPDTSDIGNLTEKCKTAMQKAPRAKSTLLMFRHFAARLDDKYDRLERLIKLSRDVTVESKRILFQLHRVSSDPSSLDQAGEGLHSIRERLLYKIAMELDGLDRYYYVRTFTLRLQKFVEAYGFYKFLKDGTFPSYDELMMDILTFKIYCDTGYLHGSNKFSRQFSTGNGRNNSRGGSRSTGKNFSSKNNCTQTAKPSKEEITNVHPPQDSEAGNLNSRQVDSQNMSHLSRAGTTHVKNLLAVPETQHHGTNFDGPADHTRNVLFLPQTDFILGLYDTARELMRACVFAVPSVEKQYAVTTCGLIQRFYAGGWGIAGTHQLFMKMKSMRLSVQKMEYSCYSLRIRDGKAKPSYLTGMLDDGIHGDDYDSGNE